MFRRLSSSLPKDPEYPADLEKLGYFLNSSDQIRSIKRPDQEFNFFISKNSRVNEAQREAMNTCIRNLISIRFLASSLTTTLLPLNSASQDPHIPILTSTNLPTAKRLILYFGEREQDLGIFAYRTIGQDSVAAGSMLDLVHFIQSSPNSETVGILVANMGQLLWYRRGSRAVTQQTWNALPRKTGAHPVRRIDNIKNHIPQNMTGAEHVKCVFESAVAELADPNAVIDVIGIGTGATEVVEYLQQNWGLWKGKVAAVCVGTSYVWPGEEIWDREFGEFWAKRARAYIISGEPLDTPLTGREDFGCNCYSAGEEFNTECIMPKAYKSMLAFFQLVNNVPGYQELELLDLGKRVGELEIEGGVEGLGGWD